MLSSMDDYPLHQIADVVRHVGTSDRYYFNLHNCSDEIFVVFSLGSIRHWAYRMPFCWYDTVTATR